jgi:hypothetical protein
MFLGLDIADILNDKEINTTLETSSLEEPLEKPVEVGFCIECEDQPASYYCEQCTDDFCQVCCASQHRKGTRKTHTFKTLTVAGSKESSADDASAVKRPFATDESVTIEDLNSLEIIPMIPSEKINNQVVGSLFLERSKYIPLRLTMDERKYLRLLEAG